MQNHKPVIVSEPDDHEYPEFLLKALHKYYKNRLAQSWKGKHILGTTKPEKNAIILQSNDYLCLSRHPQLISRQQNAMARYGNGDMKSLVFQTHNPLLHQCEIALAEWIQYPSCLVSQSGWCANTGLMQAIATRGLPVYLDSYAHMSLWEGVCSARAQAIPFQHNNLCSLEKRLARFGSGIIAVDSIYSTTGTIAPLKEICALAKAYNCITIVDESHALGISGLNGRGMVAEKNLSHQVDLITASLAKTLAGRGGMIAGREDIIEMVRYNAFPAIFSTALMPHDLIGFLTSLEIIDKEPWRAERLIKIARQFRQQLEQNEIYLCNSQTHIVPLLCGSEQHTIWLRQQLEQQGIFGSVFCAPATPVNKSLIRLSINCEHTQEQLNHIVGILTRLRKNHPGLMLFQQNAENGLAAS